MADEPHDDLSGIPQRYIDNATGLHGTPGLDGQTIRQIAELLHQSDAEWDNELGEIEHQHHWAKLDDKALVFRITAGNDQTRNTAMAELARRNTAAINDQAAATKTLSWISIALATFVVILTITQIVLAVQNNNPQQVVVVTTTTEQTTTTTTQ